MPTVRYSATIIEWMKEEVKEINQKRRKITIIIVSYIRDQTLSEGGRGFVSIEDCVNDESKNLALYALRCNEKLIIAATTKLKPIKFTNV